MFLLFGLITVLILIVVFGVKLYNMENVNNHKGQAGLSVSRNVVSKSLSENRLGYRNKSVRKGELGEYKIDLQLSRLSPEYKVLDDVFIRNEKGYAQIDHVIVSVYGVFVIEVKNYSGIIIGGENEKYWLQEIRGVKKSFYSPIKQNRVHIIALKRLLRDYAFLNFVSIVTFSRRSDLRVLSTEIVWDTDIYEVILKKSKKKVLVESDVQIIIGMIQKANITDVSIRQEHIDSIQRMKALKFSD